MVNEEKTRGLPLWRKIVTIPLLPAIILIWMIGWTLTMIGSQNGTEVRQPAKMNDIGMQQSQETGLLDEEEERKSVRELEIPA